MSDVIIIPKIRCDNCGVTVDKEVRAGHPNSTYVKPRNWGSARVDGGRRAGYPEHIGMADLCPKCAKAVGDAAEAALKLARVEGRS
jgi:hypothetical protein